MCVELPRLGINTTQSGGNSSSSTPYNSERFRCGLAAPLAPHSEGTTMVKGSTAKPADAVSESAAAQETVVKPVHVPKERALFRALLAGNPNYFGNLATSPLPPILPKQGD